MDDLLNQHFAGKIVRKDLAKLVKEGANVPVFVLEYLLGNYCASTDEATVNEGLQTVKRVLAENYVRPDEAEKIKSLIREKGTYKVIDKVIPIILILAEILRDEYTRNTKRLSTAVYKREGGEGEWGPYVIDVGSSESHVATGETAMYLASS